MNHANLTNFITRDYVLKDLYDVDDENDIMFFNRMLRHIGSDDVKNSTTAIGSIYLKIDVYHEKRTELRLCPLPLG